MGTVAEMIHSLSCAINILRIEHTNQFVVCVKLHNCRCISKSLANFIAQFIGRNCARRLWLESECGIEMRLRGQRRELLINFQYDLPSSRLTTFPQQFLLNTCWVDASTSQNAEMKRGIPAEVVAPAVHAPHTSGKRKAFSQLSPRQKRRTVADTLSFISDPLGRIKDSYINTVPTDDTTALHNEMLAVVNGCIQSIVNVRGNELDSCVQIVNNIKNHLASDTLESGGKKKERVAMRDTIVLAATGSDDENTQKKLLRQIVTSSSQRCSISKRSRSCKANNPKNVRVRDRQTLVTRALIYHWYHDNCRVNTGGKRISVFDPIKGKRVSHYIHERTGTLKELYKDHFLTSTEYTDFKKKYPNKTISLAAFKRGRCNCIKPAGFKVCADENEICMTELLKAAQSIDKKLYNCDCEYHQQCTLAMQSNEMYCKPLNGVYSLMSHMCCDRVRFMDTSKFLYPQRCCFGECSVCKNFRESPANVLQCPNLWRSDVEASWLAYEKVIHENKRESKELRKVSGTASDLKAAIVKHLPVYMKHHWRYRWLNCVAEYDRNNLQPDEVYIQVDFSSQIRLESLHKLNSEYCGVANQECWVVLHSPHIVKPTNDEEYMSNECDYIRSITPATGLQKDQDWFTHDMTLQYILQHYIDKYPHVTHFKIWSDQCPGQYKCRQNFGFLANLSLDKDITITHCFGATSQFKGVHDKVGESSKKTIQLREKAQDMNARCSSAYEWFATAEKLMPSPKVIK